MTFFFRYFFRLEWGHVAVLGLFWFVLAAFTGYYGTGRHTSYNELLNNAFRHLFIFSVTAVAYLKVFDAEAVSDKKLLAVLLAADLALVLFKTAVYISLKKYRAKGYNLRTYVIFGYNDELKEFKRLLDRRVDYGYKFAGYFTDQKTDNPEVLGGFEEGIRYLRDPANRVDILFTSIKEFNDAQIDRLIKTADETFKDIKFIPDNKDIFKKKLRVEYFEYLPVLSIRKSPLDDPLNALLKRAFDIVFSLIVVVLVLSWLTPLLALLIKLESRGPVFFKQLRNGLNYQPFYCYKFRSMYPNPEADRKQVTKGDRRVTRIGRILRKTSIDELPQFFNVLKGDMSVVGPRPHMIAENERFKGKVERFLGRHYIKPGITGLAQVKGYRGEVVTDEDIKNRVKYDLYYIENWSVFLDLKIILQTILNIFKGDRKAY
ncbi:MAG: undecaprenyl-phosphate glucose phosphotransferase [Chlorobi bacterium]|nr:undecaprenyl-phosphate glucose phosphotransferase [Chlorobiota bacterium]